MTWKPEEQRTLKAGSSPTAPDQGMPGVQPQVQIIRQDCGGEAGLVQAAAQGMGQDPDQDVQQSRDTGTQGHSDRDTAGTELKPLYNRALGEAGQH